MKNTKKMVALLLALVLLLGGAIGGTLAWLIAQSNTVVNTFVVGNVSLELTEASKDTTYKVVPGNSQVKNPLVTVGATSENCWVFVKITEENNDVAGTNLKFVDWIIADGWTAVPGATGVYYRQYISTSTDKGPYPVLKDNKVTYSSQLTQAMLKDAQPKLTFQAYAIQIEGLKDANDAAISGNDAAAAAKAWALIPKTNP